LIEATNEMPLVPAPVLVEVDYWMHTRLRPEDYARVRRLSDQYADSDVEFVDAALLAIVERLNEPKLATLDHRHFGLLRPRHVSALTLLTE
jgi:predicted nucleic acid-binding protein